MKKLILFSCILSFSIPALAQKKVFSFGVKGGFNHTWLSDNYASNTHRNSFHLGALIHLRLNDNWRLQPEVYFSAQGEKEEKNNYLVFPVLLQYRFQQRFFVEAGPQLGALVNRRAKPFEIKSEDPYRDNNTNVFDVAVAVGAGYKFTRHVSAYVRFNQGVTTVRASALAKKDFNEVTQLGVNYLF